MAFTLIIQIIIYKLFIETVYWNTLSIVTAILSVVLYYATLAVGSISSIAMALQPELNGQLFMMFSTVRFWVIFIVVPAIAVLPDATYILMQKIFFPSPTDIIMRK